MLVPRVKFLAGIRKSKHGGLLHERFAQPINQPDRQKAALFAVRLFQTLERSTVNGHGYKAIGFRRNIEGNRRGVQRP